ncbi:LacI family transcriptional regulator [Microbacterium sp. zg.Y625]|uniref:LacI family DNA-binding transcriptional regulator n=1 Tax=Microbacterium jiangjiandongii TaxID=3049071 RepID=UPI00214C7159|nr:MULTISPECIES: LacI family DNA-binding transcriptional regulator [unclassified Microbacterium]MCR2791950.1 LacI family transcriptional regulator [Microbacterium sp. zg.Y625]WIM24761.1 LacI family DNA-binding transcriptional regulator [Microbacterium sp. zg-Y625]
MSGIADVARRAGVSKATASRALTGSSQVSDQTRLRVQEAAAALGYVPSTSAVSLATGRTRNVGVIMPRLNRWFFAEVLEGIQSELLSHGLDLTLYDARPGTAGRRRIFDDFLARKRFDGLIAVALDPDDQELDRLLRLGRPVVSVVGDAGAGVVTLDDVHAAERAAEHLLALGHTDIAFLGGDETQPWASVDRRRYEGYRRAMAAADLPSRHIPSPATLPGGYAAAVDALSDARARPTGLVAVCDEVAVGAIIAARRLAVPVPGGLSVVGIDDHEYAEMFSLTTLAQNPRQQGVAAARMLMGEMQSPAATPATHRLQARLIVRNSTAAPSGTPGVVVTDGGLLDHA